MRCVLALENADYKKHSAVISHFRKEYIKTNKIDVSLSDILTTLFRIRNESDYDDFTEMNKNEIEKQIINAEYFLEQIKIFLANN